jgi:hypothetical protein
MAFMLISSPASLHETMKHLDRLYGSKIVFYWYLGEQGKQSLLVCLPQLPCQVKVEADATICTRPRQYFSLSSPF